MIRSQQVAGSIPAGGSNKTNNLTKKDRKDGWYFLETGIHNLSVVKKFFPTARMLKDYESIPRCEHLFCGPQRWNITNPSGSEPQFISAAAQQ